MHKGNGSWGGHVWVCFEQTGERFLMEATAKARPGMIRPLAEVKAEYCPNVAIRADLTRYGFHGYMHSLKRQLEEPPPGAA
jgi:hypothetical protein